MSMSYNFFVHIWRHTNSKKTLTRIMYNLRKKIMYNLLPKKVLP